MAVEVFTQRITKCPVEGCEFQCVLSANVATRGWLYLHLLNKHGWSIRKIERYLNNKEI